MTEQRDHAGNIASPGGPSAADAPPVETSAIARIALRAGRAPDDTQPVPSDASEVPTQKTRALRLGDDR